LRRPENVLSNAISSHNREALTQWKLWAGLIISLLFLYLAFRKVDLPRLWAVIDSVLLWPLCIVIAIAFLQYIIRSLRWVVLLEPIKKVSFDNCLLCVLVGFAANCIFPARLGEFIRAACLGAREELKGGIVFGSIVVERFFDGLTLLLVLVIGLMGAASLPLWEGLGEGLRTAGLLVLLTYLCLAACLVGLKLKADSFSHLLNRLLFFIPASIRTKIIDTMLHFSLGLVLIKSPKKWILAVFYSFLLWFTHLFQIQLIESAINVSLPFLSTFIILAMASFGAMIPSGPGFIGTFHLAVQYGFMVCGISSEEALSAAILWHASSVLPTILFGAVAMLFLRLPLRGLILERETFHSPPWKKATK
jgi:uncharacterized protein (TIRG00374 family)